MMPFLPVSLPRSRRAPPVFCLALCAAALHLSPALAFTPPEDQVTLGLLLRQAPDYLGSTEHTVLPVPWIRASLNTPLGRFSVAEVSGHDSPLLAFHPWESSNIRLDMALGSEPGRTTAAARTFRPGSQTLIGLDERPATTVAAFGAQFHFGSWQSFALFRQATQGFAEHGTPQWLTLGASQGHQLSPAWACNWGIEANWANASALQRSFGIRSAEADRSAWPSYPIKGAGLRDTSLSLQSRYTLAPHWLALAGLRIQQLHGSARDSPLSPDNTPTSVTLGMAYRW